MKLNENIVLPIKVGDTILTGRFKNKKTVVKSIGKDEYGMPTINGRKVVNFRIVKESIEVHLNDDINSFFYLDFKKYAYKRRGVINKTFKSLNDKQKYEFLEKLYVKLFQSPTYRQAGNDIEGKGKELYDMLVGDKVIKEDLSTSEKVELYSLYSKAMKAMPGSPKQKKIKQQINKIRVKHGMKPLKENALNEIGIFKISQFTKGIIPPGRLDTHTPEAKKDAIKLIKNFHSMLNAFWRENDIPYRARLK